MRKVFKQRAWYVRLKGQLVKPGALEGLHAYVSGGIKFPGATVANVKAFFWAKL